MRIVLSCVDLEATEKACLYYVCTAAVALQCRLYITRGSYPAATRPCFWVLGCKHYAILFHGSCFMPYKRHDDIVAVACYI